MKRPFIVVNSELILHVDQIQEVRAEEAGPEWQCLVNGEVAWRLGGNREGQAQESAKAWVRNMSEALGALHVAPHGFTAIRGGHYTTAGGVGARTPKIGVADDD